MSLNEQLETEVKCDIQAEGEHEAKKPGNISESSGTEAMILVVQFQNMTNQRSINTYIYLLTHPAKFTGGNKATSRMGLLITRINLDRKH